MAPSNTKELAKDAPQYKEGEVAVSQLQELLAAQKDERLNPIKVWVNKINPERGMLYMGIALGKDLGCSPFCGCAAKQIGDQFEPFLLERLPWLTRVVMEPEAPEVNDPANLLMKLL